MCGSVQPWGSGGEGHIYLTAGSELFLALTSAQVNYGGPDKAAEAFTCDTRSLVLRVVHPPLLLNLDWFLFLQTQACVLLFEDHKVSSPGKTFCPVLLEFESQGPQLFVLTRLKCLCGKLYRPQVIGDRLKGARSDNNLTHLSFSKVKRP